MLCRALMPVVGQLDMQGAYNLDGFSIPDSVFSAMSALGTLAFAYGGHNVVLEIQVCSSKLASARLCNNHIMNPHAKWHIHLNGGSLNGVLWASTC